MGGMREKEHAVLRRVGVAGLVVGAIVLLGGPAWAHVEVTPDSAPQGGDAVLAFTVPDESETLSTTEVAVFFPTDHPIAEALVEPIAGWTAKVDTMKVDQPIETDQGSVTEAVKSVTWTGGKIGPGDFQQFKVSVGLPKEGESLTFKTLQTYSDGSVVRWIEEESPTGTEPEHPAPVLTLTSGDTTETTAAATPSTTPTTPTTKAAALPTDVAKKDDVDSAKTLSVVGIAVGAVGLLVALAALVRGRRPRPS
jgi:uncharacterized protein YcnI